jgi:hypothetical protein
MIYVFPKRRAQIEQTILAIGLRIASEPPRVSRRPVNLSYATFAGRSSEA